MANSLPNIYFPIFLTLGVPELRSATAVRLSSLSTVEAVATVVWKRTFGKLFSCILPPEVARRTAIALMVG